MSKVFISYSHADSDTADEVASILEELKIDYFRDRNDIKWGDPITPSVREGLEAAAAVVVIISPESMKSHWVPYEVGYATALHRRVLPYLTHPEIHPPGFIKDLSYCTKSDQIREFFGKNTEWATSTLPVGTPTNTSAQANFQEAIEMMPALLAEMKDDLSKPQNRLVREFAVLSDSRIQFSHGNTRRFEYYADVHDQLQNKADMLEESGFVYTVKSGTDWKVYRMTSEFVKMLADWQSAT